MSINTNILEKMRQLKDLDGRIAICKEILDSMNRASIYVEIAQHSVGALKTETFDLPVTDEKDEANMHNLLSAYVSDVLVKLKKQNKERIKELEKLCAEVES